MKFNNLTDVPPFASWQFEILEHTVALVWWMPWNLGTTSLKALGIFCAKRVASVKG
jgi:hypothetical protein